MRRQGKSALAWPLGLATGLTLFALVVPTCLVGCGKKSADAGDAKQSEQATTPLPTDAAPNPAASATAAQPAPAEDLAKAAAEAMRKQDYAAAAAAISAIRFQTNVTGDQLRVSQNAAANLYSELAARAAKGDPQAKAALEQMKRLQDRY